MKAALALTSLTVMALPARGADEPFTGDVTDVTVVRRVEQHPGAALVWEPFVATGKSSQLVVTYGIGIPGKTDMGDIAACLSMDDGKTWSEPVTIFDHRDRQGAGQFGYANAVLYHPPGQDVLWCFAMRCPMSAPHSEDSKLAAAYSGDGGRSWIPVELTMHYTGPLIIVAGIYRWVDQTGTVRYLLPAHRNTKRNDPLGTRDQFVLESTSLLEWKLAGFIPQPDGGPVFLHEGNIAVGDGDRTLKIVMRTSRYDREGIALDPPTAYSSRSLDGGRTWSVALAEPALYNACAKGFFGRTAAGTEVYVYNDGPARSRFALRYKTRPPGKGWSPERTFFDAGTHNSYPTLIEKNAGEYYAVWDSGTADRARTLIRFAKFRMPAE
jgi:hypothetical protein